MRFIRGRLSSAHVLLPDALAPYLQGNRPWPHTLILMKRTHTYKTNFIEHSGAFEVGSKWGEVGENRPQSDRFGLSFTRNFVPKR